MISDREVLELPDMAALAESCSDEGLPFVEKTAAEAWRMGYAYLWHRLSSEEKERLNGR